MPALGYRHQRYELYSKIYDNVHDNSASLLFLKYYTSCFIISIVFEVTQYSIVIEAIFQVELSFCWFFFIVLSTIIKLNFYR